MKIKIVYMKKRKKTWKMFLKPLVSDEVSDEGQIEIITVQSKAH